MSARGQIALANHNQKLQRRRQAAAARKAARKLTPWYPMTTDPAHEGVYEIRIPSSSDRRYARWTHGEWQLTRGTVIGATDQTLRSTACYAAMSTGWRGLSAQGAKS